MNILTFYRSTILGSSRGNKDGIGSQVQMSFPRSICFDGKYFYVSDFNNHQIKQFHLSKENTWIMNTFAGNGTEGNTNGTLKDSSWTDIQSLVYDAFTESIFIADFNSIRNITKDGMVSTIFKSNDSIYCLCIYNDKLLFESSEKIRSIELRGNILTF